VHVLRNELYDTIEEINVDSKAEYTGLFLSAADCFRISANLYFVHAQLVHNARIPEVEAL